MTNSLDNYIKANKNNSTFVDWISHFVPENVKIDARIFVENSDFIRIWNNSRLVSSYKLNKVVAKEKSPELNTGKGRKQKRTSKKNKKLQEVKKRKRRKTRRGRK